MVDEANAKIIKTCTVSVRQSRLPPGLRLSLMQLTHNLIPLTSAETTSSKRAMIVLRTDVCRNFFDSGVIHA
jgi:hypothetical protein